MGADEVADFIEDFAIASKAPVRTGTEVRSLRRACTGYVATTDQGEIHGETVVIASGACNKPSVPAFAASLPPALTQLTAFDYRNPDQLPEGGVLVVGASATGVQLAASSSARVVR